MSSYEMLEHSPAAGNDDDEVMRDLMRMILEQIWWVIGIAAAVIMMSVIYVKICTPIYSADALIQVEAPNANTSSSSALAALAPGGATHTDAEIEVLRSRAVVEPVVEAFKLNFAAWPRTMPVLGKISHLFARPGHPERAWFGMRSYAWGGEQFEVDSITVPKELQGVELTLRALGDGRYTLIGPQQKVLLTGSVGELAVDNGVSILVKQLVARPGTEFSVMRANQLDALQGLVGGLQVSEKGHDTGIVQLSYMGPNPQTITAITNAVAASYMKQRTERAQEEASKMLDFLNGELPRLRDELQRSESALSDYQARVGSFQPTQEAQLYLTSGIEYEKQIAALRISRAQLLTRFTLDSPEVRTIDAQLDALMTEKARFEGHFKTLPGSEREAVSLQRDAKVAEEIYTTLLNKTQELSITRAGTVGNVHILDEALVPSAPVRPKGALIVSAGVLLGIIAGVLFAFCRRTFFYGIDDPDFIERRFHLPIFGTIPYSVEQARADHLIADAKRRREAELHGALPGMSRLNPLKQLAQLTKGGAPVPVPVPARGTTTVLPARDAPIRSLLVKTHPYDLAAEGLRGLRATLQFGLADAPNRIVAFTSPAPTDGKSFVCANLAALLAESGKRVLLIDADLRRGRLAHYLGRSPNGGLTELLTGHTPLEIAARTTGINGLHFISAGAYPPNPSEILSSPRFLEVLQRFEEQFDLVIIDTPPLLAVADAAVVANVAGSTILVMRAGVHSEAVMKDSLKKLRRAHTRLIGGVLNAAQLRRGMRYSGADYAYAYAYSTGNPDED